MNTRSTKIEINLRLLQFTIALVIVPLLAACATERTEQKQDLEAWVGVSVETLDTHVLFSTMPMFRTNTDNGTEIRNYAYGYDFGECFVKAGASKPGDFVNTSTFITCSSSRIVCNNLFYIKEEKILEYAPTGRCHLDIRTQPTTRHVTTKS